MAPNTIGQVARRAGVGVETIRYYERRGLIQQPNDALGAYREYPETVVDRVRFIRHAKDLGFTLKEIAELLSLRSDPRDNCAAVKARAEVKARDIEARIQHLERMVTTLRQLAHKCEAREASAECPILDSLEG